MKMDSNLLNEFAKITNDKDNKETPKNIYGTIVKNGDETYVRLDGSEDGCLTPVTMTMDADDGDAVLCKIENHTVTVVGNVEHPAQSLKSSSAYNTIEEIVGGMAITSKGVKVFYQENEPEGTAEYPLNPGDTWYKLDPDTGLAITIFVYTKDLAWKETALIINAANVTGKLTANQIDATGLKVNAANVTGKLTANQIDATGLKVNAANVTGKLTANQIDASELIVEDANIKSINGNKIKDGTIIAAALSHEAILTASGIKIYYQPVEPQRTLISSVVNGATTSWCEDNEGHIMRNGDTWYKTVKMANDPNDYCQIVYVYNSSTNQFKETPLDAAVLRENSITAREIDVNELAANEAFINRLKVNAANVTGKLTANQIDATGLSVNAANVTGKLTANQIDATGLSVNAANVTGKLTANQIDASGLKVNAANVTGKLTANQIDASKLIAENVLVKDSSGNVIFDASSSNHTVKIGDIVVTTNLLDKLTNAVRLATGKALVVSASNLSISEDGTITAKNGNFTGTVNATSGSFTGTIRSDSIISGATITGASGEFTKKFKVRVPMFSDYDDDHFVISAGSSEVKIGSDLDDAANGCITFLKGTKGVDVDIEGGTVNIFAGAGGVNIGDNTITQTKGTKGYVLSADGNGNTVWKRPLARKTCTADNISIPANGYKSGTISVTATSGYEIFAVGGFSLGNASSSGTGSSNGTVSICNVSSVGSKATIAYQINTWSSSAIKVKLVVHCLERPI